MSQDILDNCQEHLHAFDRIRERMNFLERTFPLIAEAFHRTGAIEIWGRGTNRVIEECSRSGLREPSFREENGAVVVTFWAEIGVTPQVTPQVTAVLEAAGKPVSRETLQQAAGIADREHFRKAYLKPLLEAGWLEMTIPDKPQSSLQQYRITNAGLEALQKCAPFKRT